MQSHSIIFYAVFLTSLISFSSTKPQSLEFSCVTQYPTTSFVAETKEKKLNLRMINHNGVKFIPIHSGLITMNDLQLLTERAEVLKNVGEDVEVTFDLENCDLHQDTTFSCYRGSIFKGVDGTSIQAFALSSSFTREKFSDFVFDQTAVMLGLIINEKSYYVEMKYQTNECTFK